MASTTRKLARPFTPAAVASWLTAVAVVVIACGGSGRAAQNALDEASVKWLAAGPTSYTISYERRCLCANSGVFVAEVRDGVTVSVEPAVGIGGDDELPLAFTVPMLFAVVQAAIDRGAAAIDVDYDGTLGYPIRITIDNDRGADDDELVVTARLGRTN